VGKKTVIRAIGVMTFDDGGKVVGMKAFHGPSNVLERPRPLRGASEARAQARGGASAGHPHLLSASSST
jgi:hypothetical protein